ncbi:MAG: YegS/Rv2252/BmrU family lipid kinase [Gemmataceae bacterium]
MSARRVCVLFNPKAGSAAQIDDLRAALRQFPSVTVRELGPKLKLEAMAAEAARERFDVLAVAGGDGTVHAAANGLVGATARTTLAVFPLGTGNDLCRTLGIPLDVPAAVELLRTGRPRGIDVIRIDTDQTKFSVNVVTGGVSGEVTAGLTKEIKEAWGPLAYLRGAVGPLSEATVFRVSLRFDHGPAEQLDLHNLVVANGRTAAGGVPVAPLANPEDGLMEVVIIRAGDKLDMAVVSARVMAGDYHEDEFVERRKCKHLAVESDPPLPLSIDGEVTDGRRVTFEVIPKAIRVLTGPDYRPDPMAEAVEEDAEPGGTLGGAGEQTFRQRLFAFVAAVLLLTIRWARVYAVGLLVAIVASIGFGLLARQVTAGSWQELNLRVHDTLRAGSTPGWDRTVGVLTDLGGTRFIVIVSAVLVLVLAAGKRYLDAATLLAVQVGCLLLQLVLKAVFAYPRPDAIPGIDWPTSYSFPSGHSLQSVGLYGSLAALLVAHGPRVPWRWACAVALVLVAAFVCWSRLYLGVHWLTDVIGGSLAAVVWVSVCLVVRANVWARAKRRAGEPE